MGAELESLLLEARSKSDAETEAAEVRSTLAGIDTYLVELGEQREELSRLLARTRGAMGWLRRSRIDANVATVDIARIDTSVEAFVAQQGAGQTRLRELERLAHGAELARARLGAEMQRRTRELRPDDPARDQLAELADRRANLMDKRATAAQVAALAGELLLWIDAAEGADDGTHVVHVELRSASHKWEGLQQLLSSDFATRRMLIKDRLDAFATFHAPVSAYPMITRIAVLAASDDVAEPQVWLHTVRQALKEALDCGVMHATSTRQLLVEVDDHRVALLSA